MRVLTDIKRYFHIQRDEMRTLFNHMNTSHFRIFGALVLATVSGGAVAWVQASAATNAPAATGMAKSTQSSIPPVGEPVQPLPTDSTNALASSTNSSSGGSATNTDSFKANVNVNGQSIPVPDQGSVHKDVSTQNGTTSVDISSNSTSSGSSGSTSSLNVEVHSHSESTDGSATP